MINQIQAVQSTLSKSEQKVAQTILGAPHECVKSTLHELSRSAGVSEPTIVRFCRSLQVSGYREFRLQLAQDLANQVHYQHSKIDAKDSASELIGKVIDSAISSLSRVRDQLNPDLLDEAILALSKTRKVEIYGVGGAAIVVDDAQLKLARIGINTQTSTDVYLQRVAAGMLEAGDCVLAISISGRSKNLIENIKIAKESKAKVISLTASGTPLAAMSDIHLAIDLDKDEDQMSPIKARIAHMAVVDTLAIGLAIRSKPDYLKRLRNAARGLDDLFDATTC